MSIWDLNRNLDRRMYWAVGCIAFPAKYFVEAATLFWLSGKSYRPLDFLNPLAAGRIQFAASGPEWLGIAWATWSVPFLLLALVLTIRRCKDAGWNRWFGLFVVVPILNLPFMLLLAVWPSSPSQATREAHVPLKPYAPPTSSAQLNSSHLADSSIIAAIFGIAVGAFYLVGLTVLCVYVIGNYGAALFFGAPLITGAAAGYMLNRYTKKSAGGTVLHSLATMLAACMMFLAFGLEGIICIVMAIPIMLPIGCVGALVGRSMTAAGVSSQASADAGFLGALLALPCLAVAEATVIPKHVYEVCTSVEVAAPPQTVWDEVVGFSKIDARPNWLFRLGVAYPTHATIDGTGVGSTRYCEFSTGTFVEPITEWSPPNKLAFDVSSQPDPMRELSPYNSISPPHLHGAFTSVRGEFRIVELPNNRCRLEGSTWYTLDIHPNDYWTVWTDGILHLIHRRVLDHIKVTAEQDQHARLATKEPRSRSQVDR